jgi:drug/metabolite transporter (DMT)-like permease
MLLALLPLDRPAPHFKPIDRWLVLHCALMAIPGIVINAVGWQYALKYAGAGMVATCFGASPVFVFLLSRVINGEPLSVERGLGILLGFTGLLVLGMSKESALFTYEGLAFTMIAVCAFSIFTVAIKRFAARYAGLPLTAFSFTFGALYLLPLAWWEVPHGLLHGLAEHWQAVAYLSLGTTGLAYLCYFKGLEKIDATSAASIILLKPPAAALLAWYWGGEALTVNLGVAIVFIVGGLYLVVLLGRRRQHRLAQILQETP